MSSAIDKIKSLIEDSQSFAILSDKNPENFEFLAKEALKTTINKKNIPIIELPQTHEDLKNEWSDIISKETLTKFPKKTVVKLPKEKYKVKEVSYKDDPENVSFLITSENNTIEKEDVSLEEMLPCPDVVFCFFENKNKIENFKNSLELLNREKIVFITQEGRTTTEKIFDILKIINSNILDEKNVVNLLLASLITETNNFSNKKTKETLSLGSTLLENGGNQENILKIIEKKEKGLFFTQILGRALARTYVDDELKTSWSFLNSRDLQKTNNSNISIKNLYKLTKKIGQSIKKQNLNILCWQTEEGIKSIISAGLGKGENYLLPLAHQMNAKIESRFFVIGPFKNFSESEIYLKNTLKDISL